MKIHEAINWILNRGTRKGNYSLEKINYLLNELGNPQNDYATVLIGGTNGKGSVAAITQSILLNCPDYVTGCYTSPHLTDIRERIKVGGRPVSDALWIKGVSKIKDICKVMDKEPSIGAPAFFEVVTALAFWIFRELEIDIAILEVGLGGRFDSTNACGPEVSVITNVGTDHKEMLGNTREAIAKEKLGIIRKNRTLITAETDPAIISIFEENVKKINGKLVVKKPCEGFQLIESSSKGHRIKLSEDSDTVFFGMPGEHQLSNLSVALELIEQMKKNGFDITEEAKTAGISQVKWAGRLQWFDGEPSIILDGAHNLEGIDALTKYLKSADLTGKINIIFGALKDKPVKEMAAKLQEYGCQLYFVSPKSHRALTLEDFKSIGLSEKWQWEDDLEGTIEKLKVSKDKVILICGSLYLIGEALKLLEKN